MDPIRVLIVDDHPMIRKGLRSVLSSFADITVVGEAEDSESALGAVAQFSPEVLLLDIQLTGESGVALTSKILKQAPETKILVLTAYSNDEYVTGALQAGAYGYLLKSSYGEAVVDAIRQVHQGKRIVSPELMDRVLQQYQGMVHAQSRDQIQLSEEERQLLTLIAQGATIETVGSELHWGERSVRRKIEEIMAKLGAKSRAQAVAEAIRKGLI